MASSYTIKNARLVTEPFVGKGGEYAEMRVADNPSRRKAKNNKGEEYEKKARFVTLKFFGGFAKLAAKLSKGDMIAPSGELEIETFIDKEGNLKDKDVMTVLSMTVLKSETFFGDGNPAAQQEAETDDELPF